METNNLNIIRFIRIWNQQCERMVEYWLTDKRWKEWFETCGTDLCIINSQSEQAAAFFFMGLLPDAYVTSKQYIYDFIKKEVERRKSEKETD